MRHFGESLKSIQSSNFKKPAIGGAIELPVVLNERGSPGMPPIRLHLYFDKKGKAFVENIEIDKLEDFKNVLTGFKSRAGSAGIVIIFADKSIPCNMQYIKAISDFGLYARVAGVPENEKYCVYKNLYEIEGPPPPDGEETKIVALKLNSSSIILNNKKISSLDLANYLGKNTSTKLKMTIQKGISWQRVMDIYNEFPSDVFIVY